MAQFNTNGEIKQINTAMVNVCELYQRPINSARVTQIVKQFDVNLVNPLKVSFRDGKYWVFDGQHTMTALKRRNGGRDLLVDCRVYYGLTIEDEARLFVSQNGVQGVVKTNDKYKALFNIGDFEIVGMVRAAERQHCTIDFRPSKGPGRCVSLSKLHNAYRVLTKWQYDEMLRLIYEAWPTDKDAYSVQIIGGLALFVKTFEGQYQHDLFVRKLQKESPTKIIRDGNAGYGTGDKKYARVFYDIYNRGQRGHRLDDKL